MQRRSHRQSDNVVSAHSHHATYRIAVQGKLSENWLDWFEGLQIRSTNKVTEIEAVVDQAALRGLLCGLWDLNLTLISVERIETGSKPEGELK